VRVLDRNHVLPGPYGTKLLADIGAEVVHIQAPPDTDELRSEWKFDQLHRCNKSIVLNMKQEEGRTPFLDLAETADSFSSSSALGGQRHRSRVRCPPGPHSGDHLLLAVRVRTNSGPYQKRVGHDLNYPGFAGLFT